MHESDRIEQGVGVLARSHQSNDAHVRTNQHFDVERERQQQQQQLVIVVVVKCATTNTLANQLVQDVHVHHAQVLQTQDGHAGENESVAEQRFEHNADREQRHIDPVSYEQHKQCDSA